EDAKVPVGKYSLYLTDLKSETDSSKVSFEVVSDDSEVDDPAGNDDCETTTAPTDNGDSSESPSETPSETDTSKPTETETEKPSESSTPSPSKTDDKKDRARRLNPGPAEQPTGDDDAESEDDAKSEEPTEDPTTEVPKSEEPSEDPTTEAPKSEEPSEDPTTEDPETDKAPETDEATEDESEDQSSESTGPASPGSEDKKEPAAAKQALSIDPTEISSEDFLNEGIKLGVTGAQPGEKITITVEHAQGKVDRYTMTKEADSEGKATFGVQAKVKAVLGTYNVRAQAESFDEPQGGSFTVLTNGTAVDEDGNGSDSAGSDLPRTGAEMTGLAL